MRFLILILLMLLGPVGGAFSAEVVIGSLPAGLDAWADQRYVGRTPISVRLPEGTLRLRLAEPSSGIFQVPLVDTLLHIARDDTLRLFFRAGRFVTLRSEPFGLTILQDGERVGKTPMVLRFDPDRASSYKLLTPEGAMEVPSDSLVRHGTWTWRGDLRRTEARGGTERPIWRKVGRYVLPGVAVALGVGGLLTEDGADRAYERYQRSVDPTEIEKHYDDARSRDAWAAALWIGAEVSLATALVAWIFPEKNKGGAEEESR